MSSSVVDPSRSREETRVESTAAPRPAHAHAAPEPASGINIIIDDNAWESDHPYRQYADGEDFPSKWHGSCHCGQIRYVLSRDEPLASKYCHCVDCQRMHGAPFQWAAIFHKSDIRFLRGVEGLAFYSSSLGRPVHDTPCKVYCSVCHSPIMDEGRRMVMLFPPLVKEIHSGGGKEAFRVRDHICWGGRVVDEGVFEGDGVRKWAGVDGMSILLDDGKMDELQ